MTPLASQRHLFDVPDDVAYFNCAYNSPQRRVVLEQGTESRRRGPPDSHASLGSGSFRRLRQFGPVPGAKQAPVEEQGRGVFVPFRIDPGQGHLALQDAQDIGAAVALPVEGPLVAMADHAGRGTGTPEIFLGEQAPEGFQEQDRPGFPSVAPSARRLTGHAHPRCLFPLVRLAPKDGPPTDWTAISGAPGGWVRPNLELIIIDTT